MATADMSWMPTSGRHAVNIGTSLARALKAKKGAPVAKRSTLPDRDFYSFRCADCFIDGESSIIHYDLTDNFKPESIDSTKPGFIEVKRGKDSTSVVIERPSTQVSLSFPYGPQMLNICQRRASTIYLLVRSNQRKSGSASWSTMMKLA
jgi:hypothetical protein